MTGQDPNVLVVILDSLRARNTTLSGYHRETTPFLSEFAESATVYTQARAAAARSLPSHASLFTGHPPQEHGLHTLSKRIRSGESVFDRLEIRGYATALFSDNPYITDLDTGLSTGFQHVYNNRDLFEAGVSPSAFVEEEGLDYREYLRAIATSEAPLKSTLNGLSWMAKWRSAGWLIERSVFTRGFEYASAFADWRRDRTGPWAACVNLMDTHVPFRPDAKYDRWQTDESRSTRRSADMDDIHETEQWKHELEVNAYDGTIRQADAVVERLIEGLRADGVADETLVIVTSDHGEAFGERRVYDGSPDVGHGGSVEEPVLHVPLVVKEPNQTTGRTVETPVSLAATPGEILAAAGADDGGYGTRETVVAGARVNGADVHAVYEPADRGVRKYVLSETRSYTEAVPTPRDSYLTEPTVPDRVHETVGSLTDAGVTRSESADVYRDTERRLSALGYTE
ncbi:MAG: sulfatase [Halobaculum sp.]